MGNYSANKQSNTHTQTKIDRLWIFHSSDPTASGCTGTYSASSTLPSVLAAKCDEATCTTLQTSVTNLGKILFLVFFFLRAWSLFGAFLLRSVRMNLKSCKFETWPHARTFAKCGKLGFVISPLSLSLPSLADLPTAVVLLCPAQIIAISAFFLLMTKLTLSSSPSLSSVSGLKLNSWYIEVPVVSFESHGGKNFSSVSSIC